MTTNPEVTFTMPTLIPISNDFFQNFSPPSPTATTTPISISPYPNDSLGVSQTQVSILSTTSLFTKSTATTRSSPPVTTNVSDTGERASGFSVGPESTPISPLLQDDPDTVFGDDRDAFEAFHFTHFNVQQGSDEDDAPMTAKQFKTEKVAKLLSVADSAQTCKDTTEKVAKLLSEAQAFMGIFQTSFESNTTKVNQVISTLGTSLHAEKDDLEKVLTAI